MSRLFCALLTLAAVALPLSAAAQSGYRYDDRYDDRYNHRYDDRYDNRGAAAVRCSSSGGRARYCMADVRRGVRLLRQESRSPCIQGRTWGFDRRGIWVAGGCRAIFQLGGAPGYDRPGYGYGAQGYRVAPGYGGNQDYGGNPRYGSDRGYGNSYGQQVIRCESQDGRQRFCRVSGGLREAQIVRRLSRTNCQLNYNWGYRRDGIWVDQGCRAEFRVY